MGRSILPWITVVAAAAGCSGWDSAGSSHATGSAQTAAATQRPVIRDLPRSASTPVGVSGGTPVMRARARSILEGMGQTAIDSVRFARPPVSYRQFHSVPRALWVYVAVRTTPFTRTTSPAQQTRQDWLLAQADVFDRAFLSSGRDATARIRGTSLASVWDGKRKFLESGTEGRESSGPPAPATRTLVADIRRAAAAGGFGITSITVTHPARPAVVARFSVSSRAHFAARLDRLYEPLSRLGEGLDGLTWELHDSCGAMVAQSAYGWVVNPNWECPEPFIIGIAMGGADCRKLAARFPSC